VQFEGVEEHFIDGHGCGIVTVLDYGVLPLQFALIDDLEFDIQLTLVEGLFSDFKVVPVDFDLLKLGPVGVGVADFNWFVVALGEFQILGIAAEFVEVGQLCVIHANLRTAEVFFEGFCIFGPDDAVGNEKV